MGVLRSIASHIPFVRRGRKVVPLVRLQGVIMSGGGVRRGISLEGVEPQLKKAFSMKGAKAVALIVNSPGGSPVQSALVCSRIRELAKKSDLPVLAFCEDVAASGGYWLAAGADEIYANKASIIGSIGVVSAGFGFEKAIEKLGVERRVYTAGENKMILDPFKPERAQDVERLREIQDEIHRQFIDHVVERRGGKLDKDRDMLFSGAFWTGARALELGLVDGLSDCRSTVTEKFGEDADIIAIQPKKRLLGGLGGMQGALRGGIPAGLVDEAVELALERLHLARFGL